MYKHRGKVVIQSLQVSAVTQTVLDGQTIHPPVANFLQSICATNYENWLAVDKVITKISRLTFVAHPVLPKRYSQMAQMHSQKFDFFAI